MSTEADSTKKEDQKKGNDILKVAKESTTTVPKEGMEEMRIGNSINYDGNKVLRSLQRDLDGLTGRLIP